MASDTAQPPDSMSAPDSTMPPNNENGTSCPIPTATESNPDQPDKEKKKTSFLDLAAELRNDIYTLALVSDQSIEMPGTQPTLLLASKQVRKEGLPIYYGANVFHCDNWFKLKAHILALPAPIIPLFRRLRLAYFYYSATRARLDPGRCEEVLVEIGRPIADGALFVGLDSSRVPNAEEGKEYWVSKNMDVAYVAETGGKHTVGAFRVKSEWPLELGPL